MADSCGPNLSIPRRCNKKADRSFSVLFEAQVSFYFLENVLLARKDESQWTANWIEDLAGALRTQMLEPLPV
jgi:hypothetical protein